MKLSLEEANLVSIFIRKLKPGKSYKDFREAWYPRKGFGIPVRVINSLNKNDESEILSVGFLKLPADNFEEVMKKISTQEAVRHDKISEVIESTTFKSFYRIIDDNNLS